MKGTDLHTNRTVWKILWNTATTFDVNQKQSENLVKISNKENLLICINLKIPTRESIALVVLITETYSLLIGQQADFDIYRTLAMVGDAPKHADKTSCI